jgi:excisionase family DNA binding protein
MNDQVIPPAVLRLAEALVASGFDPSCVAEPPKAERTEPYLVSEAAKELRVHVSTVYRDVETGRCGAFRVGAGRGAIRIPAEDFKAYQAYTKAKAVTRRNEGAA